MKMSRLMGIAALLLICLAAQAAVADDGNVAGVKELISAFKAGNADADDLNEALIIAFQSADVAAVKALIAAGADVNTQGVLLYHTPLMRATRRGHTELVKMLLDAGANANMQDNSGETALIDAARQGHTDTAKLLINVDVNNSNAELIAAAADGNTNAVQKLLSGGADAGARKNGGFSALMCAAFFGHTDTAMLLIDSGANVNVRDVSGIQPLLMPLLRDVRIP